MPSALVLEIAPKTNAVDDILHGLLGFFQMEMEDGLDASVAGDIQQLV